MPECREIIRAAFDRRMFENGDSVLAAVSGGPDSVAMLHALRSCSSELGISLHIAHLNHGIRGEQSDADAEFVRELARGFGIPVTIGKADVPALMREMKAGEEETARIVRYEFLRRTATETKASKIAVGHTADDRAESVLLNIIRGAGVDGLGSIRPVQGNVVRPLIETLRSEVEAYIAENGLPFRVDETNMDLSYARNRIRHELLPLLERDYNPQIKNALLRLAEIACLEHDLICRSAEQAAGEVTYRGAIDAGLFGDLPAALRFQIVRREIERLKEDLKDVTFEQVERVVEAVRAGGPFTITLPSGTIYAGRKGDLVTFKRRRDSRKGEPFDVVMDVPGRTEILRIGLVIEAEMPAQVPSPKIGLDEALLDADAIAGNLRARSVRPGDRIVPLGMRGSKKLQDVFVDKHISRDERAAAAVVVDDERVLWVVGVVRSEAARVADSTRRVIRLRAVPCQ